MNKFVELTKEQVEKIGNNSENRIININHVNRLKEQMKNSFSSFPPITVNKKTNNIIDGQHRKECYLKLINNNELPKNTKLSIMYVDIDPSKEKEAIINANTNSKGWALDDFISSYVKSNDNYAILEDWCKTHVLCVGKKNKCKYRYGAAMIKGIGCAKVLKEGDFTVTEKELELADTIHSEMCEIISLLHKPDKGNFFEYMAIAWHSVRDLHTFDEWKKAFKTKGKSSAFLKRPYFTKSDWEDIFAVVSTSINKNN